MPKPYGSTPPPLASPGQPSPMAIDPQSAPGPRRQWSRPVYERKMSKLRRGKLNPDSMWHLERLHNKYGDGSPLPSLPNNLPDQPGPTHHGRGPFIPYSGEPTTPTAPPVDFTDVAKTQPPGPSPTQPEEEAPGWGPFYPGGSSGSVAGPPTTPTAPPAPAAPPRVGSPEFNALSPVERYRIMAGSSYDQRPTNQGMPQPPQVALPPIVPEPAPPQMALPPIVPQSPMPPVHDAMPPPQMALPPIVPQSPSPMVHAAQGMGVPQMLPLPLGQGLPPALLKPGGL